MNDPEGYAIITGIMKYLKSIGRFFRRSFRRLRRRIGRTGMVIIISCAVGILLAIAIILALKIDPEDYRAFIPHANKIAVESDLDNDDSSASEDITTAISVSASDDTKIESTALTTVLELKENAQKGYMNRCVFLGDSRTVAMVNLGLINDDQALAQIGISHPSFKKNSFVNNAGKTYTLNSYLGSHQVPVIYIALGVNGINDPSEEHYESTFIDLIDTVMQQAPNSNIVLMSIGPVDDNGAYRNTVQNSRVKKYNDFLLNTAKEKHIFYLDIYSLLSGTDGQVKKEYDAGDGLHYSSTGCQAIFDYIVSHPVPGIPDDGDYVVKYIKPNPKNAKITMDEGSGIDEEKLAELMKLMMQDMNDTSTTENSEPTPAPTPVAEPVYEEHHEEEYHEEEHHEEEDHHEEEYHEDDHHDEDDDNDDIREEYEEYKRNHQDWGEEEE